MVFIPYQMCHRNLMKNILKMATVLKFDITFICKLFEYNIDIHKKIYSGILISYY